MSDITGTLHYLNNNLHVHNDFTQKMWQSVLGMSKLPCETDNPPRVSPPLRPLPWDLTSPNTYAVEDMLGVDPSRYWDFSTTMVGLEKEMYEGELSGKPLLQAPSPFWKNAVLTLQERERKKSAKAMGAKAEAECKAYGRLMDDFTEHLERTEKKVKKQKEEEERLKKAAEEAKKQEDLKAVTQAILETIQEQLALAVASEAEHQRSDSGMDDTARENRIWFVLRWLKQQSFIPETGTYKSGRLELLEYLMEKVEEERKKRQDDEHEDA